VTTARNFQWQCIKIGVGQGGAARRVNLSTGIHTHRQVLVAPSPLKLRNSAAILAVGRQIGLVSDDARPVT
jgi:hypothetical protein